jgi:hypothetical protein
MKRWLKQLPYLQLRGSRSKKILSTLIVRLLHIYIAMTFDTKYYFRGSKSPQSLAEGFFVVPPLQLAGFEGVSTLFMFITGVDAITDDDDIGVGTAISGGEPRDKPMLVGGEGCNVML